MVFAERDDLMMSQCLRMYRNAIGAVADFDVARDAYVSWKGSRYSVPWGYAGKEAWVGHPLIRQSIAFKRYEHDLVYRAFMMDPEQARNQNVRIAAVLPK